MKEDFKILTARDHTRLRPGMYVGSTSKETYAQFVMGEWLEVTYVPAINKMISEILDNSIDEYLRSDGKFANKIDVSIEGNVVTVTDNGRGIPQEKVQTPEGELIPRPVAAWTRNNAGTSFGANRTTIGAHGLGAALVNYMSKTFVGKTWQKGNLLEVNCVDGCIDFSVKTHKKSGNGTEVSFEPDFDLFDVNSLDEGDQIVLVEDRLVSLQLAFPDIKFSFNKKRIQVTDMKKYAELFVPKDASVIIEKNDNLSFFFASSEDGFRNNSFINGVNTRQGGVYVDFIVNNVMDELAVLIKKRHKIEVHRSTLKNGITFVLFAREFNNPKFDSQTKERLTNSVTEVRDHFEQCCAKDFKFFARKLFAADDIIETIIAAQLAKKEQQERREALRGQKKLKKIKVAKHIAASSSDAALSLCEGDSATGFFLSVRDPKRHGIYPLRGVIMNTWDLKPAEVLKNKELSEVIAILGLDINNPDDISNMNYKEIWTLADADVDGNKISTLLIGFFYKFWPKLFEERRVSMLKTPIMIASKKGQEDKWFYTYKEAEDFKSAHEKSWKIRYIKGLGLLTEDEYSKILQEPVLYNVSIDSPELLEMMFGGDSQPRKEYMMG
jgi:DNA gyrase/topoisomerase IV subunit B